MDMTAEPMAAAPLIESLGQDDATPGMRAESLAEAIAQVETAPVPAEVDPALFAELQAELVRVIREAAEKGASIPPSGEHNRVTDLALVESADGWELSWSYLNTGDYNLDGLVGVSDLTPVGVHFDAEQGDPAWPQAQCADGNHDGMITVADITPIGQNFGAFVAGYNVYGSDEADGPWTEIGYSQRPAAFTAGSLACSFELAAREHEYYRVEAVDAQGSAGDPSDEVLAPGEPAQVSLGTDTILTSEVVPDGGSLLHGPAGSPLEGMEFYFPSGVIGENMEVGLGYNDGSIAPVDGVFQPPIIVIDCGDVDVLPMPLEIRLPFPADQPVVPVLYDIGEDGILLPIAYQEINYETGMAVYRTMHASRKALILGRLHFASTADIGQWDTGFRPRKDGFFIVNKGSMVYPKGECMGMTAFSMWYYRLKHYWNHGFLYLSFRQLLEPGPEIVQDVIATRAHTSIHTQYNSLYRPLAHTRFQLPAPYRFAMIRTALLNSGGPITMTAQDEAVTCGHSMLVCRMSTYSQFPNAVILGVYDPNKPGRLSEVGYYCDEPVNWDLGKFAPYASGVVYDETEIVFADFILEGEASLRFREHFASILEDALDDPPFGGSNQVTIRISEPADGSALDVRDVVIRGQALSGEVLVDSLGISAIPETRFHANTAFDQLPNQSKLVMPDAEGYFAAALTLLPGPNTIGFAPFGYDADENHRLLPVRMHPDDLELDEGFPVNNGYDLEAPFGLVEIGIDGLSSGQQVPQAPLALSGTLTCGDTPADRLEMLNGADRYEAILTQTGDLTASFALSGVNIGSGVNNLLFKAWAEDVCLYEYYEMPTTYSEHPFVLIGAEAPPPGQVTIEVEWGNGADCGIVLSCPWMDGAYHYVSKQNPGSIGSVPYALFEDSSVYGAGDVVWPGNGHYTITIAHLEPGGYALKEDVWHTTRKTTLVKVSKGGSLEHTIIPTSDPKPPDGEYSNDWVVLRIDGETGEITVVNEYQTF